MDDVTTLTADDVTLSAGRSGTTPPSRPRCQRELRVAGTGRRMHLSTYEKGIEGETLACGTGSVASAVIFAHDGRVKSPVRVVQHSGDVLLISFEPGPNGAGRVRMEGPVR
jgi:diaminopimelate epimerase